MIVLTWSLFVVCNSLVVVFCCSFCGVRRSLFIVACCALLVVCCVLFKCSCLLLAYVFGCRLKVDGG